MKRVFLLIRDDRGSISAMTVVMLAAFVGLLALVVDLGHLHTVQGELRNAADACSLRGARAFYADVAPIAEPAEDLRARTQALAAIGDNYSDLQQLSDLSDVATGVWDFENRNWLGGAPDFSLWDPKNNKDLYGKIVGPGIFVSTRKEGGVNSGPVAMTLAQVFGIPAVDVKTWAYAALSPVGKIEDEDKPITGNPPPLQVGDKYAGDPDLGIITLHPSNTDTGGWHSYYDPNPNTPTLGDYIWGRLPIPEGLSADGAPINRLNGVVAALFSDVDNAQTRQNSLYWRWMDETGRTAAGLGPDAPAPNEWVVWLPVTESDGPYVGSAPILGFTRVSIERVWPSPLNTVDIKMLEPWVAPPGVEGGGRYYGIISLEPKLVELEKLVQ